MQKMRELPLAILLLTVLPISSSFAQNTAVSGLYQIRSGTFEACCGLVGRPTAERLPNNSQSFVRLGIDLQSGAATLTFLGADTQTVFQVFKCPPASPDSFSFGNGMIGSRRIVFQGFAGLASWSYSVSNVPNTLLINGMLRSPEVSCSDMPGQFAHTNVVADLLPLVSGRVNEVVFDSFGPGDSYANDNPDPIGATYYERLAVPFTPSNSVVLRSLTVAMSHFQGDNVIQLTVRPDVGGKPGETILATRQMGGFPTAPECVAVRSCTTNYPDLGTVKTDSNGTHPLLTAGAVYWVVAEPPAPPGLIGWHGVTTATYGRAYDTGSGWRTDLESTYALRVEGTSAGADGLFLLVKESGLPKRRQRPLLVTLRAIERAVANGHCERALKRLDVFEKKVRARVTDASLAGNFLAAAQIMKDQGCNGPR